MTNLPAELSLIGNDTFVLMVFNIFILVANNSKEKSFKNHFYYVVLL